ncbi:MAG: CopD family protein [Chloroflexota bacterium]|nr:CopD family protein [Chloroflexota bacterium]
MSPSILAISYFFHLIATMVWVGGLAALALLVVPAARRVGGDSPTLEALLSEIRRRFFPLTNFALVVLVVTGLIQMAGDEQYDGVLQFTNDWSRAILLKHVAVGGMFLCGLSLQYAVIPALERARLLQARGNPAAQTLATADIARLRQREARLTWLNVVLGALTLAFTAWATAI